MAIIIDAPAKQSTMGAVRALGGSEGVARYNCGEVDEQTMRTMRRVTDAL